MSNYISTRGDDPAIAATEALFADHAPDGGSYVPQKPPRVLSSGDLATLAWLSHGRRTAHVFSMFVEEVPIDVFVEAAEQAFGEETLNCKPVWIQLEDDTLQLIIEHTNANPEKEGNAIFLQALAQLTGKESGKAIAKDSNNWAYLLVLAAALISAYCELVLRRHVPFGQPADVCLTAHSRAYLPAVYYAKQMGVPFGRIVCREEGVVQPWKEGIITPAVFSYSERMIFETSGRDSAVVAELAAVIEKGEIVPLAGDMQEKLRTFLGTDESTHKILLI